MGVSAILQPGTGTGTFCGFHSIEDPALLVKKGGRNVEFGWRKQLKLPLLQYRHALVVKASGAAVGQNPSNEGKKDERGSLLGVASASIAVNAVLLMSVTKPEPPVSFKSGPSKWQHLLPLAVWGAILFNAFVQYKILERLLGIPQGRKQSTVKRVDLTLKQRVEDLEGCVREFVTTSRVLSRQVEKLGVRFRVTRRTLRDPIQETVACTQKTSEVVRILAQREEILEKEIHGLQQALFAMQEQQVKQLELISLAIRKGQNGVGNSESKPTWVLKPDISGPKTSRVFSPTIGSEGVADTRLQSNAMQRRRHPSKESAHVDSKNIRNGSSSVRYGDFEEAHDTRPEFLKKKSTTNGSSNIINEFKFEKEKVPAEGRLSNIDFWKESGSTPVQPSQSSNNKSTTSSISSSGQKDISTFFSGRKRTASEPNLQPDSVFKSDNKTEQSEDLGKSPDELEFVAQPDYESDSWLR